MVIVGGGYIANELAGIFYEFGVRVTMVNRADKILRGYDESIRERLLQISMAKGIDFRFNSPIEKIQKNGDGTLCVLIREGDPIVCDMILFASGRVPNTSELGLQRAGVELDDRGAIIVNEYSQTTRKSIYAVGDVTNRVQL